jgi:hypothetical protein
MLNRLIRLLHGRPIDPALHVDVPVKVCAAVGHRRQIGGPVVAAHEKIPAEIDNARGGKCVWSRAVR